jgi:HK97 family phage prohead protease
VNAESVTDEDRAAPDAVKVGDFVSWGIPTGSGYDAATSWFARKAEQIKDDRSIGMSITPVKARNATSGVEFRSTVVELRAEGDGNTFVGYAAMFDAPSQPLPFTERIAPGAFAKTLANRRRDVRLYVNHNSDLVLASKRSGTLTLSEDDKGLRVEAELPETTYAADLRALMRAGVVDRMSFGFTVPRGGDKWSDDGRERELREIVLHEVSVVTGFPAYEQTQASVRSVTSLADRVGMDVDELHEVLDALADNEQVDPAKAARLIDALQAATPAPEPDPMVNLIGLKQKQVELLSKKPV